MRTPAAVEMNAEFDVAGPCPQTRRQFACEGVTYLDGARVRIDISPERRASHFARRHMSRRAPTPAPLDSRRKLREQDTCRQRPSGPATCSPAVPGAHQTPRQLTSDEKPQRRGSKKMATGPTVNETISGQ